MKEMILPIVRYIVLALGANAVGNGLATKDDMEAAAGFIAGLLAFGWMLWTKWREKKAADLGQQEAKPYVPKVPVALLLAGLIGGLAVTSGCVTNTPGRVLASTAVTVDAAMTGWGQYVAAGLATQQDREAVAKAYAAYQAAELAAESAYIAAYKTGNSDVWTRAAEALRAAESSLLTLLDLLKKPKTVEKPQVHQNAIIVPDNYIIRTNFTGNGLIQLPSSLTDANTIPL